MAGLQRPYNPMPPIWAEHDAAEDFCQVVCRRRDRFPYELG